MIQGSRRLAAALSASFACLLAACTTQTAAPESQLASQPQTGAAAESSSILGSRIPRKTTERLVRQTNAAGAKEMERSRPPEPGMLNTP